MCISVETLGEGGTDKDDSLKPSQMYKKREISVPSYNASYYHNAFIYYVQVSAVPYDAVEREMLC